MANRFELGHRAWPILTGAARRGAILYYADLSEALGYHTPKVARAALSPIQDYCLEIGLPPLTSIVVNRRTGVPGSGFIAAGRDLGDAQKRVFCHDWSREVIPFPSESLLVQVRGRQRAIVDARQHEVPDVQVTVNGRGPFQEEFRRRLMHGYGRSCALCDSRHPAFLVASHIVPWSEESRHRLNPRNGILLCRTHDAAFEAGLLRIAPGGGVTLHEAGPSTVGRDLSQHLRTTANQLRKPKRGYEADPQFLGWRYERSQIAKDLHLSWR